MSTVTTKRNTFIFKITIHAVNNRATQDEFILTAFNDLGAREMAVAKWQALFAGLGKKDKPQLIFCTCEYIAKIDN